jgi:hypothetical protein
MTLVESHQSPDGLLKLLVDCTDNDWTIGFEGAPFHTHGDILSAWGYDGSPEQATKAFVTDIIQSRRPIVIWRVDGKVRDFDVPVHLNHEELAADLATYGYPGETVEARYWNGRQAVD